MYDVTIEVKARGTDSDFANNCTVEYKNIKDVAQVNLIQRQIVEALFGLGKLTGNAQK